MIRIPPELLQEARLALPHLYEAMSGETMDQKRHGLTAGAARREITPRAPQFLDGYGNRMTPSEGVYHPIYARALYLSLGRQALVVSAEVLAFDFEQARRIRRAIAGRTGVAPEAIILAATHTHCAPRVCNMVMPGSVDPEYVRWFEGELVEAAAEARACAAPAAVTRSRCEGDLGVNRRVVTGSGTFMRPNPEGVNVRTIDTLWFQMENAPAASLSVYACHPTSRGGFLVGGDYPGFLSADLEERTNGVSLFSLGCAGDIRPHFENETGGFRHAEIHEVESAGRALAAAVWNSRGSAEPVPVTGVAVSRRLVPLPFVSLPSREDLGHAASEDAGPLRRQWVERMLACPEPLPTAAEIEIQSLGLQPGLALLFMAGEMVVDYAVRLSREAGPAVIPAGYANGSVGYVPSRRIYPEGGYEVTGSYHLYGQPAPFTEDAEDLVAAAAGELIAESLGGGSASPADGGAPQPNG